MLVLILMLPLLMGVAVVGDSSRQLESISPLSYCGHPPLAAATAAAVPPQLPPLALPAVAGDPYQIANSQGLDATVLSSGNGNLQLMLGPRVSQKTTGIAFVCARSPQLLVS